MRRRARRAPRASSRSITLLAGRGLLPCMQLERLGRFVLGVKESRILSSACNICRGTVDTSLLHAAGA